MTDLQRRVGFWKDVFYHINASMLIKGRRVDLLRFSDILNRSKICADSLNFKEDKDEEVRKSFDVIDDGHCLLRG